MTRSHLEYVYTQNILYLKDLCLFNTKVVSFTKSFDYQLDKFYHPKGTNRTKLMPVLYKTKRRIANFEVFHMVIKHCVECLILRLKQDYFRR